MTLTLDFLAENVRESYEPSTDEVLPYVGLEHIEQQSLHLNSVGLSSSVYSTKKRFIAGDILFGTLRPYFRKVVRVNFDGVCSTDIAVIRSRHKDDGKFVFYLIAEQSFIEEAALKSNGTRMPRANWQILAQKQRDIPIKNTRYKISAVLSAYDDLIENNTRRIQILEEMAQALYSEWFVHFRFPGHEQSRMMESTLGLIPEGWIVRQLEWFGRIVTGKTPSKEDAHNFGDDVPFVKTPDMKGNVFCVNTAESLSMMGAASQKTKTIPPDTICVSCIGTAGVVALTGFECQTNQQINSIVPENLFFREFLYFAALELREKINLYGSNGATMVNLNKRRFQVLDVVVPPKSFVERYHSVACSCFDQIKVLQTKNMNLRQTRDLLLPKLISGEVSVDDMDIEMGTGGDA